VYVAATTATGIFVTAIHLSVPNLSSHGVSQAQAMRAFVLASASLGLARTPLAAGIGGKCISRWLVLSFLPFICLGANASLRLQRSLSKQRISSPRIPQGHGYGGLP
jgi:hypothetical protein